MACTPCCEPCPTMCAQAGSNLNCIFDDIGNLLTPFAPAINKKIANSGQPSVAQQIALANAKASNNSSMLLMAGAIVIVALLILHHA